MGLRNAAVSVLWLGAIACALRADVVGAKIENVRMEGPRVAFVRVANKSDKEITGVSLSLDLGYKSGKQTHFDQSLDLLPEVIQEQSGAILRDAALLAGQNREITITGNEDIAAVNVTVNMVAYLDRTYEGDPAAIARMTTDRKDWADTLQEGAAIIGAAAADHATPDPVGMALHQLKDLCDKASGTRQMTLKTMMQDVRNMQLQKATPEELKTYGLHKGRAAAAAFKQIKGLENRSNLTKKPGGM